LKIDHQLGFESTQIRILREANITGKQPPESFLGLWAMEMFFRDKRQNPQYAEPILVFEGNTHFEAIRMHCRDFEWLERPRRGAFSERGNVQNS